MIYVALAGANQAFEAQGVHANNLANSATRGFRADRVQFATIELNGGQDITRYFPQIESGATDFKTGTPVATGNNLDVAISGDGWFVVKSQDGKEAYTRNGNFKVDQNGVLKTANDLSVLGDGGEITIPAHQNIAIGIDGTISIQDKTGDRETSVILDRLKLVKPEVATLVKNKEGLFVTKDNKPAESDSSVQVMGGYVETSNVNAIAEITNMISMARLYEMHLKLMSAAEENDRAHINALA